jgi:hypothetical protein
MPTVLGLSPEALKHSTRCRLLMPGEHPAFRDEAPGRLIGECPWHEQATARRMLQGFVTLERVSEGTWAMLSWPLGPSLFGAVRHPKAAFI